MRRVLALLVLCLVVAAGATAQSSIEELNGYDWITLSTESKVSIIRGWYLACTMLLYQSYEIGVANKMSEAELTEMMSNMEGKFAYKLSTVDLARQVDAYYSSPGNRKFLIYRTIPFLAGKEWWNRQTGVVEPTIIPSADGS